MEPPAPFPIAYATPLPVRPARPRALMAIAATAVLAGPLVGATTNAINAAVSPAYFISVMGWYEEPDVWLAGIRQGILEGMVVGLIFSAILTITIGIITRATCTYRLAMRWLAWIVAAFFAFWVMGGIAGVAVASFHPMLFRDIFIGVPAERSQLLRYAWVGGSIWGIEPGGLIVIIASCFLIRLSWRKMLKQDHGTPWS